MTVFQFSKIDSIHHSTDTSLILWVQGLSSLAEVYRLDEKNRPDNLIDLLHEPLSISSSSTARCSRADK